MKRTDDPDIPDTEAPDASTLKNDPEAARTYYREIRDGVIIGDTLGAKAARVRPGPAGGKGASAGTVLAWVAGMAAVIALIAWFAVGNRRDKTPPTARDTKPPVPEGSTASPAPPAPVEPTGPETPDGPVFSDFIGVNLHIQRETGAYSDRKKLEDALNWLGIGHVRDGIDPYQFPYEYYSTLHENTGVKISMITGFTFFKDMEDDPTVQLERILELVEADEGGDIVDIIEGQNEPDLFVKQGDWVKRSVDFQKKLWKMLKEDTRFASLGGIPVAGASVTGMGDAQERWAEAFPDASEFMDYGNIHPYPGGFEPEGGFGPITLKANLEKAGKLGDMPLLVTETGYLNDTEDYDAVLGFSTSKRGGGIWVSETAAGIYLPRLLLHHLANGLQRVYWYELFDRDGAGKGTNWGLFENDGVTPKPAGHAMRNILEGLGNATHLADAEALEIEAADGKELKKVRQVSFRAPNGERVTALWLATGLWNGYEAYGQKKESAPDEREVVIKGLPASAALSATTRLDAETAGKTEIPTDSEGTARTILSERVTLLRYPD